MKHEPGILSVDFLPLSKTISEPGKGVLWLRVGCIFRVMLVIAIALILIAANLVVRSSKAGKVLLVVDVFALGSLSVVARRSPTFPGPGIPIALAVLLLISSVILVKRCFFPGHLTLLSIMRNPRSKCVVWGALLGLADGVLCALSFTSVGLGFLAPLMLLLAFPCFGVALRLGDFTPKSVAWAGGVLAMTLLGAAIGFCASFLLERPRAGGPDVTDPSADPSRPTRDPGGGP
ncbi:MAG: hypothetical protein NT154_23415 [Verrucomicrobia bacterium]|nr:hypothetical protein [Verrucomicrobiota bacterium]